ncbi:MAG: polysaccharide biosynthesis tyrosine autokinase [Planctomycetes bacterium]|nr:polysaccharide biosynthesis tyrosine autokinase [Planctomycetota bacterium]
MSEPRRSSSTRSSSADSVGLAELLSTLERHRGLVLGTVFTVAALGMVRESMRPPVFRAEATLKLERDEDHAGVLGELAALTSAPAAEGEMSILRSRAMVRDTVDAPEEWTPPSEGFTPTAPDEFHADRIVRLGLTTRVEAESLRPLADLWRAAGLRPSGEHRLFAKLEPSTDDAPRRIRVRFPSRDRIVLSRPSEWAFQDVEEVELAYTPDAEYDFHGARLRLHAVGGYEGESYVVEYRSLDATAAEFASKLSVEETARNSGVIRVQVADSDPYRAAELANALGRNYLARTIKLSRSRATRTIEFIEEQLASQQRELDAAEREVVRLQQANPAVIMVSASAETLITRLASLEADRARIAVARVALAEAAEMLENGDNEALARLSRELPDLVSLSYIEAIGRLGSEAQALERSDVGASKTLLRAKLAELEIEDHEAGASLTAVETAIAALESGDGTALTRLYAEAPRLASLDASIARLAEEASRIDAELASLKGDLTPSNPRWAQLAAARKDLDRVVAERLAGLAEGLRLARDVRSTLHETYRASIDAWPTEERERIQVAVTELTANVARNLRARLASLATDDTTLGEQIASLETELSKLPESEREVAQPMRRREAHAQVVKRLIDTEQQARLSEAAAMPSAILIDPALPPTSRHSPRLLFDFVLFVVAGLGLGALAAFARQSLSGAVHTQAEVEEAAALSVLGSIPRFSFRSGFLGRRRRQFLPVRDEPDGPASEAYRSIRENIRFLSDAGAPIRTFGITSCAPSEGKTTSSLNLAMAFAGERTRVLIVDADMRKPATHLACALELSPGLSDVLESGTSWRDCIQASGYPGLDLICAGDAKGSPGELLRSRELPKLIEEWQGAYDLVILDLPPTLVVADVEVLAHELDSVVLVYRSGGVHRDALGTVTRKLNRAGANVVGVVLNAVPPTRSNAAGYGQAYGYTRKRVLERRA